VASPDTFASDAEREAVADRLRVAAGEGRLTADELGDRLGVVYSARTHGELESAAAGLPEPPEPAARPRSTRERASRRLQRAAIYYAPIILVCILVWAVTGADPSFWPKWVILGVAIRMLFVGRAALLTPPSKPKKLPPAPPGNPRR
jgi:hypothetical protein